MSTDELKAAAEMSGLEVDQFSPTQWRAVRPNTRGRLDSNWMAWHCTDPALPAYLAELLVAKVRESSSLERAYNIRLWAFGLAVGHGSVCASAEQRIAAAMKVLT